MAKWTGQKVNKSQLNGGEEYNLDSDVAIEEINSIVNNSLYASNIAENVANQLSSLNPNDKIEFKGSNPNLLINGDFRVNQRGQTSYAAPGTADGCYCVDRWRLTWRTEMTSINKNSISIKFVRQYGGFSQKIENFEYLKGKTITLSCKISNCSVPDGLYLSIADGTNAPATPILGDGFYKKTLTISNEAPSLSCTIFNTHPTDTVVTLDLEYMKLEIGSVATAFSPRPYAEELEMCKRYCLRLDAENSAKTFTTTFAYSTTSVGAFIPCKLRTLPTILLHGGLQYRAGSGTKEVTDVIIDGYTTECVALSLTTTAVAGETGLLRSSVANSYIFLDAEM